MSALEIRKLTPHQRSYEHQPCHNLCRSTRHAHHANGPSLAYRSATHEVLICGYPTMLCDRCTTGWRRAWESALDQKAVAA